jgi:hypothetical protein
MHREIQLIKDLSVKTSFERIPLFRETIMKIKDIVLSDDDIEFLEQLYLILKDIPCRCFILQTLALKENGISRDFFFNAFKKERYLDMKLTAIRGYANYSTEQEVEKLMSKFTELLVKRQETTPYDYEEYELIRSVFGLPYLIKKYNYKCFIIAYEQEEKQYNAMPNAFKGYFTLDEKGNHVGLMNGEEIRKKMNDFFKHKKNY